jgi:hypothetical protein
VNPIKCTQCGGLEFAEGFVSDLGQGALGFGQWIAGPIQTGVFGNAKVRGRTRIALRAYRCANCSHLEIFAS